MPNTNPTLPSGFVKRHDAQTGYDYYVNTITGSSQWTLPRTSAYVASQMYQGSIGLVEGTIDPDTVPPPHGYHNYATQSVSSEYNGLGHTNQYANTHNQHYLQHQQHQQQQYQYYQQQQEHMLASQHMMPHSSAHRVHRTHLTGSTSHHAHGGSHNAHTHRPSHNSHSSSFPAHSRPSSSRPGGQHHHHSGSHRSRHRSENHSDRYKALSGILAGGLAALSLSHCIDANDVDGSVNYITDLRDQMDYDGWFDEYP